MSSVQHSNSTRKTIGIFASRIGRNWDSEFIIGAANAAEALDLNMLCFVGGKPNPILTPGQIKPSYGLYDIAHTEKLDGIILSGNLGYELNEQELNLFIENFSTIPIVTNAIHVEGSPNLICDNVGGMRTAIRHLLDMHGYKNIAFIRGPEGQLEAEQRFFAYKQELKAHHIPFNPKLVFSGRFDVESGREATQKLLDQPNLKVDAIAAANDHMAIGAFEALQIRGIRVPEDIGLIGFDDIRESRFLSVPLTTVHQPFYEMGTQAVELLARKMKGELISQNETSAVDFIPRWSCGCPHTNFATDEKNDQVSSDKKRTLDPLEIVSQLLHTARMADTSPNAAQVKDAAHDTWRSLLHSISAESPSHQDNKKEITPFLQSLLKLFKALPAQNDDIVTWYNLASTLYKNATQINAQQTRSIIQIEELFQQARVLIDDLSNRKLTLRRMQLDMQDEKSHAFSTSMAPAMSLEEIRNAVERHFPSLGIMKMYVMLYSNMTMPQSILIPPGENYHLLMHFNETGAHIPVNQPKWATRHLTPPGETFESGRYSAIVMPLSLAQNRFGILWMGLHGFEWENYVSARNLISSALLRTMLVEQRTLMQKQVEHLLRESQLREEELAIATDSAERAAKENARLYTNEQERRQDAEMLSKVSRNLSTLMKLDELPQQILDELTKLLPYERGALFIEGPDGKLTNNAQIGFLDKARVEENLQKIEAMGLYTRLVQNSEPFIIDDFTSATEWQPVDAMPVAFSWMCVPLFSQDRVTGMLSLTREGGINFSQDDLLLVATFATQASISLENARLYDKITRFNESLERLVAQRVEELNAAYGKLEKLDKSKTSFIQVTAHELRTPITVMKGYLGMLKGTPGIRENESLSLAVDGVLKGTDRLHQIVNSMLDVVRLENQSIVPHLETVAVSLLLQRIEKEYRNDLAERNITLQFEENLSGLPFIQADPQLLQKAFDAIIVNAIKFTPDGGSINLGGISTEDERLGSYVEIHVRDTGIGIDPANHKIIFEKLFQLGKVELHSSGRTKFKGGGPGLGLAIAAGIVKAHNGMIWVESQGYDEEKFPGSTFIVRLPISPIG